MKRLILTLMISFINTTLFANETNIGTDFLERGTAWVEVSIPWNLEERINEGNYGNDFRVYIWHIDKDTVIMKKKYWKVNLDVYSYQSGTYYNYKFSDYCFLRSEEYTTLWYRTPDLDSDYLLFDYSFEFKVGNVIKRGERDNDEWKVKEHLIQKVDTIIHVDGTKRYIANDYFVYGVGFRDLSPLRAGWGKHDSESSDTRFLCYYRFNEIYYQEVELMTLIKLNIGIETDHILTPFLKNQIETDSPIYDLTGRRLNSVPEKGIYIQGGRKWIVK